MNRLVIAVAKVKKVFADVAQAWRFSGFRGDLGDDLGDDLGTISGRFQDDFGTISGRFRENAPLTVLFVSGASPRSLC